MHARYAFEITKYALQYAKYAAKYALKNQKRHTFLISNLYQLKNNTIIIQC
jgi:hypothetical protein